MFQTCNYCDNRRKRKGKNFHFKEYSDEDDANRMNYWENANEQYPTTEDYEVWDAEGFTSTDTGVIEGVQQSDLGGTNVRHHHFPSNKSSSDFIQSNHSFVDSTVEGTEFTATWTAIISAESDMNTYAADDEYGITFWSRSSTNRFTLCRLRSNYTDNRRYNAYRYKY